jgi:hypothetical protein
VSPSFVFFPRSLLEGAAPWGQIISSYSSRNLVVFHMSIPEREQLCQSVLSVLTEPNKASGK